MVIDTSALLAILLDEPERRTFNERIEQSDAPVLSTASFLETSIVLESRFGPAGIQGLDLFIRTAQIKLVPVDADQAYAARVAFREYGKGRHTAGLNFGDCFSYALAKTLGEKLLHKGNDFQHTDLLTVYP